MGAQGSSWHRVDALVCDELGGCRLCVIWALKIRRVDRGGVYDDREAWVSLVMRWRWCHLGETSWTMPNLGRVTGEIWSFYEALDYYFLGVLNT